VLLNKVKYRISDSLQMCFVQCFVVGGEFAANVGPPTSPNFRRFSLHLRHFDAPRRSPFKSALGFFSEKMKLDACDGLCEPSRVIKKAVEE